MGLGDLVDKDVSESSGSSSSSTKSVADKPDRMLTSYETYRKKVRDMDRPDLMVDEEKAEETVRNSKFESLNLVMNTFLSEYDLSGEHKGDKPPKKSNLPNEFGPESECWDDRWVGLTDEWEGIVGYRKAARCPCGYKEWIGWMGHYTQCHECRRYLIDTDYDEWHESDDYDKPPTKEKENNSNESSSSSSGIENTKMSGLSDW